MKRTTKQLLTLTQRKGNNYECAINKQKLKNHAKPTTQPITNKTANTNKQEE